MRNDKNHTAWSGIYRPPQDISFFSRSMCVMHARNAISRTCNYLDGTRNNRGFSLKLSDLRDATLVSPMLSFFPAAVTLYPIFKSWFRSIFNEFFWNISIFRKQKGFSRFKNHEAVIIFFLNWLGICFRNLPVNLSLKFYPIFFLTLCTRFVNFDVLLSSSYIYINLSKIKYLINIYTYIFPVLQNACIIFLLISISRSSNRSFPITNETHESKKNRNSRFSMHDVVYLRPIRYMVSRSPCLDRN